MKSSRCSSFPVEKEVLLKPIVDDPSEGLKLA